MVLSSQLLPNVTKHFAADTGAHCGASSHDAARSGQDARTEAAEYGRHFGASEIHAAPGAADALDAGNHFFAARSVLQKNADDLPRRGRLGRLRRFFVDELEALDVAFVFEDLRDLNLQLGRGHIDSGVLRNDGVAKAREHIGNRICHLLFSLLLTSYFLLL